MSASLFIPCSLDAKKLDVGCIVVAVWAMEAVNCGLILFFCDKDWSFDRINLQLIYLETILPHSI